MTNKQGIIQQLIDKGVLVTKEFLENNELTEDLVREAGGGLFLKTEEKSEQNQKNKTNVTIVSSYFKQGEKRGVQDFTKYFRARYEEIKEILYNREELQNAISINKFFFRNKGDKISLIGMVFDKKITKNKHTILEIEDFTGKIKVMLSKKIKGLDELSEKIVFDEVIGIKGVVGDGIVFANSVYFPDIPNTKELKKSDEDINIAFLSDIHIGSKLFFKEEFERFIKWTRGELGTPQQREEAFKLKYLFIAGDVVDGIGVYPGQEDELEIKNVEEQYKELARYLSFIREDINIIICPGNHDALRIAEPQPPLKNKFMKALQKIPNLIFVSNPSLVNIHKSDTFSGFDVLLYHGYSFDHLIANVDYLRKGGGYDNAELIMQFLLQKRHLAPIHSSTQYLPDKERDPLVISKVPDFFIMGHLHKTSIGSYNGISLICSSCWQDKTDFQEKMGHHPEPYLLPIANLKTRKIKVMNFSGAE